MRYELCLRCVRHGCWIAGRGYGVPGWRVLVPLKAGISVSVDIDVSHLVANDRRDISGILGDISSGVGVGGWQPATKRRKAVCGTFIQLCSICCVACAWRAAPRLGCATFLTALLPNSWRFVLHSVPTMSRCRSLLRWRCAAAALIAVCAVYRILVWLLAGRTFLPAKDFRTWSLALALAV